MKEIKLIKGGCDEWFKAGEIAAENIVFDHATLRELACLLEVDDFALNGALLRLFSQLNDGQQLFEWDR